MRQLLLRSGPARAVAAAVDAPLPGYVAALAPGDWFELPNTNLSLVTPRPLQASTETWNGGALDPVRSEYYCALAAGHGDSSWNGATSILIDCEAPRWWERFNGSGIGGGDTPYYADGRPAGRHTYYLPQFIPERRRVFFFGCGSLAGTNGVTERKVDAFNPLTNDFDPAGTYADVPGTLPNSVSYTSARHPITGNVYLVWPYGSVQRLARWNQADATWTELAAPPFGTAGFDQPAAVDTARNRLVVFDAATAQAASIYNIATNSWSAVGMGADTPAPASSVFYVPALDRFIGRTDAAGGTVFQIHPGTFARSAFATAGGGAIPVGGGANQRGSYSRCCYAPRLRSAFYHPRYDANCWLLRLH